MITFMESKEKSKEADNKSLEPQLWHACAGGMVQMPQVSSNVFYFPQGHAEHSGGPVDFRNFPKIPPFFVCKVSSITFMADLETDEVYSKIRLVPLNGKELEFEDNRVGLINEPELQDKPASFAKTLTQSDANNGGGFSVPRYCAETIFPRLDYSADPPVQTILAKDVHGETWKFRHIYRGTPRRHLLTTGWSNFVNRKKLVAGDSIVFLRAENGDLCVGIRRAKRGLGFGGAQEESSSGWNPIGGFSPFLNNGLGSNGGGGGGPMRTGKVRPESVLEAVTLAMNKEPFEVVYYPRASTPEFCVKALLVKVALQVRWAPGLRFKMPFETEDSSRISWFMGSISSIQVADPIFWPESPWRLLQVTWDEPDLLQNVKRVNPWLVDLVSNLPALNMSPIPPPRKKLRLPEYPEFNLYPTSNANFFGLGGPFNCRPDNNTPSSMQGAWHGHYGLSLTDLSLGKFQSNPLLVSFSPSKLVPQSASEHSKQDSKNPEDVKEPKLILFGKPILTEQQISLSCSGGTGNSSSDGNMESEQPDETSRCKVFLDTKEVGQSQTLDLSLLSSYDEVYRKLADMFSIRNSDTLNQSVMYRDGSGAVKHIGDESFSEFVKTARKLTILMDTESDNLGI